MWGGERWQQYDAGAGPKGARLRAEGIIRILYSFGRYWLPLMNSASRRRGVV